MKNVLLLLGTLAAFTGLLSSCSESENTTQASVKPLVEAVYASGHISSGDEYQVFAETDGVLVEQLVQDGARISQGQALLVLESQQSDARMQIAQEAFAVALKNKQADGPVLKEASTALQRAKGAHQLDSLTFVRLSNLWKAQATSQAEYDRAKLAYEQSAREVIIRESNFFRVKNQVNLEYEQAENNLKIAREDKSRYTIKSQRDGLLFQVTKEPGEWVRRGELIAVIGKAEGFFVKLKVDEQDVQRVAMGQKIKIKIDAFPGRFFEARVARIYPMVDPRDQSFRVDGLLLDTLPGNFTGLAAEANIVVREAKETLVIPRNLLLEGDSVRIATEEGEKKVKIKKGIETISEVEVLDGLTAGSKLIIK